MKIFIQYWDINSLDKLPTAGQSYDYFEVILQHFFIYTTKIGSQKLSSNPVNGKAQEL